MAKLSRKALKNIIRIPMAEWRHSDFIKAIDADKYVYDRTIDLFKDAWKSRGWNKDTNTLRELERVYVQGV